MKKKQGKGTEARGWTNITLEMAIHYGTTSKKGRSLLIIAHICAAADSGNMGVSYTNGKSGLIGQIPNCYSVALDMGGLDFNLTGMRNGICGLHAVFGKLCVSNQTHDLNSFEIPNIGNLVTEIRMS